MLAMAWKGEAVTIEVLIKSSGKTGHQFAVYCDFGDMGSCGRKRFKAGDRVEAQLFDVLLNNGIMATYPGGTPTAREAFGVTKMTGNYAQIARGMGAEGIEVSHAAELPAAIAQAEKLNKDGKTVMIDVQTRNEDSRAPNRFVENSVH